MSDESDSDDALVSSISDLSEAVSVEPPSDPDLIETARVSSLNRLKNYKRRHPPMMPRRSSVLS